MAKNSKDLNEALASAVSQVISEINSSDWSPEPRKPDPDADDPQVLRERCRVLHQMLVACIIESGREMYLSRDAVRSAAFNQALIDFDPESGRLVLTVKTRQLGETPWSSIFAQQGGSEP
jgi:hypothetical protein